ncbi:MAG: hypothetical protein Kow00124_24850 [Anaerolineae bacterium]
MRRAILLLLSLLLMLLLAACEADMAGLDATPQGDAGEEAAAPDQAGQVGENAQGPPEGVNPPGLSDDGPPGQQNRGDDDDKPGQGPPEGVNPPGLSDDGPPGQQNRDDRDDDDQGEDNADNRDQDEDDDDAPRCTDGQADHPQIARLARRFDVSEEEIAGWYCAGRSLGDIKTAYRLSAQSGETVAALFAMRDQGMGWGAIKQALGLIGQPRRSSDDSDSTGPVPVYPEGEDTDKEG